MTLGRLIIVMIILGAGYLVWQNSSESERSAVTDAVTPQDVDPLTVANSHWGTAHYDKALPLYEQVLEENPDHPEKQDLKYRIARCYEKIRDYETASELYKAYLKEFPKGRYAKQAKENYDRTSLQK